MNQMENKNKKNSNNNNNSSNSLVFCRWPQTKIRVYNFVLLKSVGYTRFFSLNYIAMKHNFN